MKTVISVVVFILAINFVFAQKEKSTLRKVVADKSTSTIKYDMKHPLHDWEAKCKDVNAVIVLNESTKQIEQAAVSVRVDAFDSENANRDSHTLEVLEALKYPKITFVSTGIVQKGTDLTINGNLNFHNVLKPVSIKAIRRDNKNTISIEGLFYVLLSDHKVERPSLVGMKCEDEIKLSFKIEFQVN